MQPLEEIEVSEAHRYYWVDILCTMCKYRKTVAIPKKMKVSDMECPKCECQTLTTVTKK